MFARDKRIGPYTYVYLVENVREEGRTKQRIIANLGRKEVVVARGDLDRLARSVVRLAQRSMVLSLFERLWHEVGCRAVLEELAAGRQFEFAAERAVFLTVLHRLFVSGSDRAAEKWRADYRIEGAEALPLHHLYRAMVGLGEPLADQAGASELTPRCRKDLVEEGLFARRRDLFAELSVVFMDPTSLSFEGRGGEQLGRRGHSKDYRPDLHQMIVGLVMDQDGRPLCCELWPGNTADVTTLLPVVDRLRARFSVGRIGVVADRGMISAQSIAALEERKLEYVLGVRERSSAEVRRTVIDDQTPFVPLVVPRVSGELTELEAKQVKIGNRRYIVCRNLAEARRDAEQRSAILDGLRAKLAQACPREGGGRQGARRQQRFPPLSQDRLGRALRRRRDAGRRRRALWRALCAAHQHQAHPASRHAALSRPTAGRAVVPPGQGRACHSPNLPQQRHGHSRPRVLLLPCPAARQGTRGSPPPAQHRSRMGRHPARSRPAAGNRA